MYYNKVPNPKCNIQGGQKLKAQRDILQNQGKTWPIVSQLLIHIFSLEFVAQ